MTKRRKKHYKSITKRSLLPLSAREVPRRGGILSQRGQVGGLQQAVHRDVRGFRQRIQIRVGIHLQDAGAQILIQRAVVVLREAVKPPGCPGLQRDFAVREAGLLGLAAGLAIPGARRKEGVQLTLHGSVVALDGAAQHAVSQLCVVVIRRDRLAALFLSLV